MIAVVAAVVAAAVTCMYRRQSLESTLETTNGPQSRWKVSVGNHNRTARSLDVGR